MGSYGTATEEKGDVTASSLSRKGALWHCRKAGRGCYFTVNEQGGYVMAPSLSREGRYLTAIKKGGDRWHCN